MNPAPATPIRIGPYLLTECIGTGGMAAVYRAKRRGAAGFETAVVVKTLLPQHRHNPRLRRMFIGEACLSAQLHHDNVVRVHDYGVVGSTPFLEMEFLSGWSLLQIWEAVTARGERLPVSITLALLGDACRGLAYAHAFVDDAGVHRPIIHRDVSPANVMICRDGSVRLVDFGLAQLTRGETLAIDMFQGKLAYMSPEQLERRQLDRRADVFAFGVTLYELLTGHRLFGVGDDRETLRRLQTLVIDPPSALNPEVPAALDAVVLRALARDPDERYQSAAPMLAALEAVAGLAASRAAVLRYLGGVAPAVFTRGCEDCGGRVAWGADCRVCKTVVEPETVARQEALTAPAARAAAAAGAAGRVDAWLRRRWLILQLTLCVLWRRFDTWRALRQSLALERAARGHSSMPGSALAVAFVEKPPQTRP